MPCIINPNAPDSKRQGNIWEAYCGKTVWLPNKPFKTPKEAIDSGQPICRKCRRLAELPLEK